MIQTSDPFCSCPSSLSDQLVETLQYPVKSTVLRIIGGSLLKLTVSGYTSQALHRERNVKLRNTPQIKLYSQILLFSFLSSDREAKQPARLAAQQCLFISIRISFFHFRITFERQLICASQQSITVLPGTNHSFTKNI